MEFPGFEIVLNYFLSGFLNMDCFSYMLHKVLGWTLLFNGFLSRKIQRIIFAVPTKKKRFSYHVGFFFAMNWLNGN